MPQFSVLAATSREFLASLKSDEIAVILTPASGPSPSVKALIKDCHPSLRRKTNYLAIHTGFIDENNSVFVIPVFESLGNNALERRWVFHDWAKTLHSTFSSRRLAIYFDEGCLVEDIVRAEDVITLFANPLYTDSKWANVRAFASNPKTLTTQDPDYQIRFEHQWAFRQWVNENPDELTSIEIGNRLRSFAKKYNCDFVSLDEKHLAKENMNLLLAVGQGADKSPPRLHIVTANTRAKAQSGSKRKRKDKKELIALVGKGITFDTGGINLKPHESFVNCMKNDMGGAALMSQLFMALIKSGYDGPLLLAIPACENAIDSKSMKPGVIIKSRSGKSVIIEHTDAEGRLILADAMTYIWDKYNPAHMYTAATLTTASLRQFTNYFTPVHFSSEAFKHNLGQSAAIYGEAFTFWDEFLPFLAGNKINAADLTNMGRMPSHASMGGGSNVAAHFLRQFARGPYTHIDIFNSIWNWSGDYPGAHYGCTGAVFNSLFRTLKI